MSEANNIPHFNPGDRKKNSIPEDKLMAYLEGRLSPKEQHEVEQWLADEGMESDAIEGLNTISAPETRDIVDKLNYKLTNVVTTRKRKRRKPLTSQFTIIAIILILILAVVAFLFIKMKK